MNLYDYDLQVLEWINHNRIKELDPLLIFITQTAIPLSVVIGITAVLIGIFKRDRVVKYKGTLIISGIIINEIIVNILKYSVHRVRPYINHPDIVKLTTGGSPSFPSVTLPMCFQWF